MNIWGTITWDIARSGGFMSYILLTISVVIGLMLSLKWQTVQWPRMINSAMHNYITLISAIFMVVHVIAVTIDPFTKFGLNEVLIPFISHYRPTWIAYGILSLYLGIAIGISTLLRSRIGYKTWRAIHVSTILIFAMATVHGLGTGSDTQTSWAMAIYGVSTLLVGSLTILRFMRPLNAQGKAHPVLASFTALGILAGVFWASAGPARAGWNLYANNGNGSGARIGLASAASTTQATNTSSASATQVPTATPAVDPTQVFTAALQGTYTQGNPDAFGAVTLTLHMTMPGSQGNVDIVMHGQVVSGDDDDGGGGGRISITDTQVTMGLAGANPMTYQGQVTQMNTGSQWHLQAQLNTANGTPQNLSVKLILNIGNSGSITGELQSTPV